MTPSAWRIIARAHSSHSAPPSFAPSGVTSADTEIPYGDPACASSAYLPQKDGARTQTEEDKRAVTETPELTPQQRDVLEKIIRVDQAGELGANYIYYGQKAVFAAGSDKRTTGIVQVRFEGTCGSRGFALF